MDDDIVDFQKHVLVSLAGRPMVAVVEREDGTFDVYQQNAGGVAPTSSYPNKRLAASRLLQLLGIGPVAPQTHPETACIGIVSSDNKDMDRW